MYPRYWRIIQMLKSICCSVLRGEGPTRHTLFTRIVISYARVASDPDTTQRSHFRHYCASILASSGTSFPSPSYSPITLFWRSLLTSIIIILIDLGERRELHHAPSAVKRHVLVSLCSCQDLDFSVFSILPSVRVSNLFYDIRVGPDRIWLAFGDALAFPVCAAPAWNAVISIMCEFQYAIDVVSTSINLRQKAE